MNERDRICIPFRVATFLDRAASLSGRDAWGTVQTCLDLSDP